jgi:alkanesulfonate monooxygenase SsuD/methylene tetrahydromethanopterin reductase-like flavin-dependent oxidoreductase (luciferase family)
VQVGLLIPQGWKGEYDGWDPAEAWAKTVDLARHAEELGFESAWVFDHFTTVPDPTDEITFESFSTLSALAMATERVRLATWSCAPGSATRPSPPSLRRRST